MKGKAPRKHSLHEKIAASVLLKTTETANIHTLYQRLPTRYKRLGRVWKIQIVSQAGDKYGYKSHKYDISLHLFVFQV